MLRHPSAAPLLVIGGLIITLTGCGHSAPPASQSQSANSQIDARQATKDQPSATPAATSTAQPVPATKLESLEVGAAKPVHQHGKYYLAGQPAAEDFATWKEKGVRTVITLRTPGEIDWDEKAAVEAQGMKFVSIPFRAAESLGDSQIETALKELADETNGPILLHCGTSNRVGAIWYAHRIRHDGVSPEEALTEAKEVGLRNAALTDVVNAYCERQKSVQQ